MKTGLSLAQLALLLAPIACRALSPPGHLLGRRGQPYRLYLPLVARDG